jgi:purine-nucleoside phosphorylase
MMPADSPPPQDQLFQRAADAVMALRPGARIDCAFVLGTGLGSLVEELEDAVALPYRDIPGFPAGDVSHDVSGHARQIWSGRLAGRNVLILQGRAHYYETGNAAIMRVPVGMLSKLGAPPLVLTNAAGSVRADMKPGAIALITDHINYNGPNPLIGETGDARFVSMTDAYDPALSQHLRDAAQTVSVKLHEGVYMWFSGPSFETPAEIRMARVLGADLVGMSTVPEVILARRYGLRVAGLSIVTNLAAGIEGASPSHQETRDVATKAASDMRQVIRAFMAGLPANEAAE